MENIDAYTKYMKEVFDPAKAADIITAWIREWIEARCPGNKAVIGISGGKDSTVAAALCVRALGADRVFGVLMPDGEQGDIADSYEVCRTLGIKYVEHNISSAVLATSAEVMKNIGFISERTKINLPPRIRMSTLYAYGQSVNGFVVNTCNLSEDYVGYSTRYGDAAGDFAPLKNLTSDEVVAVGKYLGLPAHLVCKTPSDGLCGKTDEDNLGFPYRALNAYIRTGDVAPEYKQRIDTLHIANLFKERPIDRPPAE